MLGFVSYSRSELLLLEDGTDSQDDPPKTSRERENSIDPNTIILFPDGLFVQKRSQEEQIVMGIPNVSTKQSQNMDLMDNFQPNISF
jgi:hypothetical protein